MRKLIGVLSLKNSMISGQPTVLKRERFFLRSGFNTFIFQGRSFWNQSGLIGAPALFTLAVRTNDADTVAVNAKPSVFPLLIAG